MGNKIRLSSKYLGVQLFTIFSNFTGWDSIGFAFPFWWLYIVLREFECEKKGKFLSFNKKDLRKNLFLIIWFVFNIITACLHSYETRAVRQGFYYATGVCFFMSIVDAKLSQGEISWCIKAYIRMAIVASLLLFIQRTPVHGYTNRLSISIFGHIKDPNYFSAYLLFPCLICFWQYLESWKIKKLVWTLMIAYAILLTGSRASFLSLVIGMSLASIGSLRLNKTFGWKVIILGGIVFLIAKNILPTTLISRFIDFNSYNDGSNRLRYSVWISAIQIWRQNVFWGGGQAVVENHGVEYGALLPMMTHSTWLDILAEFGIVGFLLFISVPLKCFFDALRQKNVLVLSGLVSVLFASSIISAHYSQYYWFDMALFVAILNSNRLQQRTNEKKRH